MRTSRSEVGGLLNKDSRTRFGFGESHVAWLAAAVAAPLPPFLVLLFLLLPPHSSLLPLLSFPSKNVKKNIRSLRTLAQ